MRSGLAACKFMAGNNITDALYAMFVSGRRTTCSSDQHRPAALSRYLHYVLDRISDHPINRVEELLAGNIADKLREPDHITLTCSQHSTNCRMYKLNSGGYTTAEPGRTYKSCLAPATSA